MEELINQVKKAAKNPKFIHHKWFVKYHLEIIERIVRETAEHYPEADLEIMIAMTWLHDYGKILDRQNEDEILIPKSIELMKKTGFPEDFIEKVYRYIEIFETKENIDKAPIEVQIVSSADGASHLVGPFYFLFWADESLGSIQDNMNENLRKANVDWEKKIVIPEIKNAFLDRNNHLREMAGELPNKFLK